MFTFGKYVIFLCGIIVLGGGNILPATAATSGKKLWIAGMKWKPASKNVGLQSQSLLLTDWSGSVVAGRPISFTVSGCMTSLSVNTGESGITATLQEDKVNLTTLDTVAAGNYNISVNCAASGRYAAATTEYSLTVTSPAGSATPTSQTVSLNGGDNNVAVGSSTSFTVSGCHTSFTATSNAPSIATVSCTGDTCTVTGVGAGNTTITVSCPADTVNGTQYAAADDETYSVTVTPGKGTGDTEKTQQNITVSPNNGTVAVGDDVQFTVGSCNTSLDVSSSNNSIATATCTSSPCTVHGVSAGSAAITVTCVESESYLADAKEYTVTVTDGGSTQKTSQNIRLTGNVTSIQYKKTNEFTVNDCATKNYELTFGDSSIASGRCESDDGKCTITAEKPGNTSVTVKCKGDNTYADGEATYNLTVNKANQELTTDPEKVVTVAVGETKSITVTGCLSKDLHLSGAEEYVDRENSGCIGDTGTCTVKGQTGTSNAQIKITCKENDNYNRAEQTLDVVVTATSKPAEPTITLTISDKSFTYDGVTTCALTSDDYSVSGANNPTLYYAGGNSGTPGESDWETYHLWGKDAGSHITWVKACKDGECSNPVQYTCNISKLTPSVTIADVTTQGASSNCQFGNNNIGIAPDGLSSAAQSAIKNALLYKLGTVFDDFLGASIPSCELGEGATAIKQCKIYYQVDSSNTNIAQLVGTNNYYTCTATLYKGTPQASIPKTTSDSSCDCSLDSGTFISGVSVAYRSADSSGGDGKDKNNATCAIGSGTSATCSFTPVLTYHDKLYYGDEYQCICTKVGNPTNPEGPSTGGGSFEK